ncbi:hypothetical protein [Ramlibacter sp.]|uniref:hypothetical protein n=1 Tax=Ramlibacter sp. TaxID=1917967 RepID=UPI0018263CEC|nr:hypothetical protein [Ramlibacter sp.]MBA2674134.1 hypothetical protein [Ramlibacter sp.]
MKRLLLISLAAAMAAAGAQAQTRIWRCGNAYTNDPVEAKTKVCKAVEGGNVTIVEGTKVANPAPAPATSNGGGGTKVASAPPSSQRVVSSEQRARDADARSILESELKKAEAKHNEMVRDYNNGEPDKQGIESRNHQRYLDRVAEMKAGIARNESDIAGIKRELARLPQ